MTLVDSSAVSVVLLSLSLFFSSIGLEVVRDSLRSYSSEAFSFSGVPMLPEPEQAKEVNLTLSPCFCYHYGCYLHVLCSLN